MCPSKMPSWFTRINGLPLEMRNKRSRGTKVYDINLCNGIMNVACNLSSKLSGNYE